MSRVDQTTRSNLKNSVEPIWNLNKGHRRLSTKLHQGHKAGSCQNIRQKGKQYAHVNKTSLHSGHRFEVSWRKQY